MTVTQINMKAKSFNERTTIDVTNILTSLHMSSLLLKLLCS